MLQAWCVFGDGFGFVCVFLFASSWLVGLGNFSSELHFCRYLSMRLCVYCFSLPPSLFLFRLTSRFPPFVSQAFRLGMFVAAGFLSAMSANLALRSGQQWRWRRRIPAMLQLAVAVLAYGSVLLLVSDVSPSSSLFSQAVSAFFTSSVWSYLRLPADVLAIAALPAIFNLAQD